MNEANVISIDPGAKTLGEQRLGCERLVRISKKISTPGRVAARGVVRMLNIISGINSKIGHQISGKIMLVRMFCGIMFICAALVPKSPESIAALDLSVSEWLMTIAGLSMSFGLLTRPVCLCGAILAGTMFFPTLAEGTPNLYDGAFMMLTFIFGVMGPGMFSVDQLLRNLIGRVTTKRHAPKRLRRRQIDYHAFGDADRLCQKRQ